MVAQKLARLQRMVAERIAWAEHLAYIKRLHAWLLDVEHLLDASLAAEGEVVSTAMVGSRLDAWCAQMATELTEGSLSELERECLTAFFQVLSTLRPSLVQCDDRKDFPRTNKDRERRIRGLKMQDRRISGRKHWNASLFRHGRSVADAAWWEHDAAHRTLLEQRAAQLDRTRWRELRRETTGAHSEQLTRFRFRHTRQSVFAALELRWTSAAQSALLP